MDLRDVTKNQHFLPQVEQRLNAINPQARSKNQKIYSFSIQDRDSCTVSIDSEIGVSICKNLSLNDLFSFDVLGKEASKYNFEKLFHSYEVIIKANTESLLSKIHSPKTDVKLEIFNIFRSKFLNFIRNPYSIKKILNTFSELKSVIPTDPIHLANFNRVLNGNKPQQDHLCEQLGITKNDYEYWLATIFFLLNSMRADQPNFLDRLIKSIYENPNRLVRVCVYTYDDEKCLLSDRGYNTYVGGNSEMVWEFNLCSYAFIRYVFEDVDAYIPEFITKKTIDFFKSMPKSISVESMHNDLAVLEIYNKHTVSFCHEHVFGASKEYEGVTVSL